MPYLIDNIVHFIIDGAETNAGDRAFLREQKVYVIDGATVGTAADRMFLKDNRFRIIDGGIVNTPRQYIHNMNMWAITGRPQAGGVYADQPTTFEIDGRPGVGPVIADRYYAAFIIDDVPQEAPPV